ncbi:NAD-dependent succinate-semialdehyde dehydrogenase [Herbaspirillum sp. DW155]|uniref:NAD-dependent succinate-semialdehyde dehydrogenase n=1 Tax=Herbaspirillum sp. DW155 TaxID=3095609 RepID=UPI003084FBC4|nr:NAD-dependent succinate-semialdehyde dehydrogenase [Herbaspirillum sp. DW155]
MPHPEVSQVKTGLHIGGQWREASDGGRFEVRDPATEEVLAEVASASVADALEAVDAAYRAGPAWAATSPRQRSDVLRRAFDLLMERKEAFARLIVLESGKALAEARGEVIYAAEFLRWYSEEAVRIQGEVSQAPGGANRILVVRQPIGVAVFVTPWNFPAAMATRKIGPALAAGCTVVLKPASETPLTALAMAEIFEEAGVPAGVINVVPSRKSGEVVKAMLQDPRVRKLSFTGSTEIGRVLLEQAAQNVVKCSMELGGNAPFIVLEDADLEVAVASAMVAKLRNGGESCTAANRFYVARAVAEEFSMRFAQAMAAVRIGPGLEEGVQLGPLVNRSTLDKVHQLVTEAVEQGARVLTGGKIRAGKGYFYEPTLLTGVRPDAAILHREIFGPVAPICVFDSIDEVIRLANDTAFGLVSFVHSQDLGKALHVAERIEAGMVGINRGVVSDPAAPFGGWKQSGVGREGGHDGLLEYLESKYICASW